MQSPVMLDPTVKARFDGFSMVALALCLSQALTPLNPLELSENYSLKDRSFTLPKYGRIDDPAFPILS